MRIVFVSLRSDDLGLPSHLLPVAAELRERGHDVAFASPDPAPARLIASAGFGNLKCPPMRASSSKVFAEPTPLVRDYDHFLALLGWCDPEFTARQIEDCMPVLRAWGPDIVVDSFDASGTPLEDPRYWDSAQAAAHQLARLPGTAGAARLIETLPGA